MSIIGTIVIGGAAFELLSTVLKGNNKVDDYLFRGAKGREDSIQVEIDPFEDTIQINIYGFDPKKGVELLHWQSWRIHESLSNHRQEFFDGNFYIEGHDENTLGEIDPSDPPLIFTNETLYTNPDHFEKGMASIGFGVFLLLLQQMEKRLRQKIYITSSFETTMYDGMHRWEGWLRKIPIKERYDLFYTDGTRVMEWDEFLFEVFRVKYPKNYKLMNQLIADKEWSVHLMDFDPSEAMDKIIESQWG